MQSDGRRSEGRLRLNLEAQLIGLHSSQRVTLLDLSSRGSKVRIQEPPKVGERAFLRWPGHEVFGLIVWARNGFCGMTFDRPMPIENLVALRDQILQPKDHQAMSARHEAEQWARGFSPLEETPKRRL
jgi:PilZ domain